MEEGIEGSRVPKPCPFSKITLAVLLVCCVAMLLLVLHLGAANKDLSAKKTELLLERDTKLAEVTSEFDTKLKQALS